MYDLCDAPDRCTECGKVSGGRGGARWDGGMPEPLEYAKPPPKGFPWARVLIWVVAVGAVFALARILGVAYVRSLYR